jgi:hypothetical protein
MLDRACPPIANAASVPGIVIEPGKLPAVTTFCGSSGSRLLA